MYQQYNHLYKIQRLLHPARGGPALLGLLNHLPAPVRRELVVDGGNRAGRDLR